LLRKINFDMLSAPLLIKVIFLPVIIILGIMTSFEDVANFKIRNRLVFAGVSFSLFIYAFCTFLSVSGLLPTLPLELNRAAEYLLKDAACWVATAVLSFTVGYVFWKMNLWGGGDAKLFLCYAMLTPIGVYRYVYFDGYFASFLHLQLTFIPATVFLILRALFFQLPRLRKITVIGCISGIKKGFFENLSARYRGRFLKTILGFLGFILFGMVFSSSLSKGILSFGFGGNIAFAITLLCYKGMARFFKQSRWILVIIYSLLVLAVTVNPRLLSEMLEQLPKALLLTVLIGSVAPFLYKVIDIYSEQVKQKYSAMAVWMFIATCIIWIW